MYFVLNLHNNLTKITNTIFRSTSIKITNLIVQYETFTPNRITILSGLLKILSFTLLFFDVWYIFIVSGLVYYLGILLDHVDGDLARMRNISSDFGAYLDNIIDRTSGMIKIIMFMIIIISQNRYGIYILNNQIINFYFNPLYLTIIALFGSYLTNYVSAYSISFASKSNLDYKLSSVTYAEVVTIFLMMTNNLLLWLIIFSVLSFIFGFTYLIKNGRELYNYNSMND
jgi:CDP-L-myo-inositol myo-inositolphosphotransferase